MREFTAQLKRRTTAPPEMVYDIISNLNTHTTWGGAEQRRNFRLLSLQAPAGPATAGTKFSSIGSIPMSLRKWTDRSTVTIAEGPAVFEFVTQATVSRRKPSMQATYRHRYEIAPISGGSEVTYTFTQLEASHQFLRLALPIVRTMTWRVGIPFLSGRGFRNMLAAAERQTKTEATTDHTSSTDGLGSLQPLN